MGVNSNRSSGFVLYYKVYNTSRLLTREKDLHSVSSGFTAL